MRYYCKNCKSEFEPNGWHEYDTKSGECPFCKAGKLVVPIPDYETPAQFKERTGKPYTDNGLVWAKRKDGSRGLCEISEWGVWFFERAVKNNLPHIVIADPPVPPPDNWRPE